METIVHTFGLNGQMVKPYTRKQIGKIAKPDQSPTKETPTSVNLQLGPPARSDLSEIMDYFAKQEATANWTCSPYEAPKRRSTDDLIREFLAKSLQEENARRAIAEAEADMPYSGLLARQQERQRLAAQALAERRPRLVPQQVVVATPPRGATSSAVQFTMGTPTGVEGLSEMRTRFFTPRTTARAVSFIDEDDTSSEEPLSAKPKRGRPLGSKNRPKTKLPSLEELE
jgi:hypothetical protein